MGKDGNLIRPLEDSLPIALLRAKEAVMARFRPLLNEQGVTDQQWRVLRVLYECGPLDPTEIAHRSVILTPSMTRILRTLEERGFITREAHPVDRRRFLITMTGEARVFFEDCIEGVNATYAEVEALYGKEKLKKLVTLLQELAETAPD